MINTKNPNGKIKLLKKEVINYLYPETKNKLIHKGYYAKCKKYIDKLTEMSIEIINKKENNRKIYDKFALCVQTRWDTGKEYLDIEFSDRILPFLVGLKGTFTQYEIGILPKLKSIYSIRMYEYFNMKTHGKKIKWEEQIEILKEILGIKKTQYKEYGNFEKILKTSQEQINKYTDLHIEYKPIKTGRKTTSIMFTVAKTSINNCIDILALKNSKKGEEIKKPIPIVLDNIRHTDSDIEEKLENTVNEVKIKTAIETRAENTIFTGGEKKIMQKEQSKKNQSNPKEIKKTSIFGRLFKKRKK